MACKEEKSNSELYQNFYPKWGFAHRRYLTSRIAEQICESYVSLRCA